MSITRFVDRDMFMRLRGGGIGHKATCDWDDILRQDRGRPVEDEDSDTIMRDDENDGDTQEARDTGDLDARDAQDSIGEPDELPDEWEDIAEWEGVMKGGEDGEEDDNNNASDADESDEDHIDDRVVADEGEELDDDIYAREGYGTL